MKSTRATPLGYASGLAAPALLLSARALVGRSRERRSALQSSLGSLASGVAALEAALVAAR